MKLQITELESPIGLVRAAATERGICAVDFDNRWDEVRGRLRARFKEIEETGGDPFGAAPRLKRYFDGEPEQFEGLALDEAGTPFQLSVWSALRRIERGQTWSYAQLAAHIGRPKAVRAVGATNGRNPIAIITPCHRVIGKAGELRGYAGGLDRKRWLLELEGVQVV